MRLADFILLFYWYPVRLMVRILPRSIIVKAGHVIGFLSYYMRPQRRELALNELQKITLPDLSNHASDIVRNGFIQAATISLETFCFPRITPSNVNHWMRIHGESHLNQALMKGNGVVIILAHYGANQMVMAALGHRGYRINQIGSRPDDWHRLSGIKPSPGERLVFNRRLDLEKSLPARFIYIDKSMRPIYHCLENNEVMILAADGRAGSKFFKTGMCDRIMNVSAGPFRIAASTGAALIPAFPIRDVDGRHDLYIEHPIYPDHTDSMADWIEKAVQEYGVRLSEWVRFRPDHYIMLMTEAKKRSHLDPVPLFEDYRNA